MEKNKMEENKNEKKKDIGFTIFVIFMIIVSIIVIMGIVESIYTRYHGIDIEVEVTSLYDGIASGESIQSDRIYCEIISPEKYAGTEVYTSVDNIGDYHIGQKLKGKYIGHGNVFIKIE